jgi:imidazolonepropionase-like amidohydrolase
MGTSAAVSHPVYRPRNAKIATTHGDLGFQDAKPDLPEDWVRKIVQLAHEMGLTVTAHSYGDQGNWAAVRGGVDGIEHLVNVPHSSQTWTHPSASGSIWL